MDGYPWFFSKTQNPGLNSNCRNFKEGQQLVYRHKTYNPYCLLVYFDDYNTEDDTLCRIIFYDHNKRMMRRAPVECNRLWESMD